MLIAFGPSQRGRDDPRQPVIIHDAGDVYQVSKHGGLPCAKRARSKPRWGGGRGLNTGPGGDEVTLCPEAGAARGAGCTARGH